VKRLAEHVKSPAILLVSERLRVGEEDLETGTASVVRFKGVLPGKRIVETAEQLRKEAMK
jgi:hypothetical protein